MDPAAAPSRRLGDLYCVRCGEGRSAPELDRHLWCEFCVSEAQRQAKRIGWTVGAVLGLGLAAWIWLVQRPSDLVIGGWIATVVAAVYLGARVGREVAFGALRFKYRPD